MYTYASFGEKNRTLLHIRIPIGKPKKATFSEVAARAKNTPRKREQQAPHMTGQTGKMENGDDKKGARRRPFEVEKRRCTFAPLRIKKINSFSSNISVFFSIMFKVWLLFCNCCPKFANVDGISTILVLLSYGKKPKPFANIFRSGNPTSSRHEIHSLVRPWSICGSSRMISLPCRRGLKPLIRMLPTGRNFALSGKINNILRLNRVQQFNDLLHIIVKIHLMESKIPFGSPLVGKKQFSFFWRTADSNYRVIFFF